MTGLHFPGLCTLTHLPAHLFKRQDLGAGKNSSDAVLACPEHKGDWRGKVVSPSDQAAQTGLELWIASVLPSHHPRGPPCLAVSVVPHPNNSFLLTVKFEVGYGSSAQEEAQDSLGLGVQGAGPTNASFMRALPGVDRGIGKSHPTQRRGGHRHPRPLHCMRTLGTWSKRACLWPI